MAESGCTCYIFKIMFLEFRDTASKGFQVKIIIAMKCHLVFMEKQRGKYICVQMKRDGLCINLVKPGDWFMGLL